MTPTPREWLQALVWGVVLMLGLGEWIGWR